MLRQCGAGRSTYVPPGLPTPARGPLARHSVVNQATVSRHLATYLLTRPANHRRETRFGSASMDAGIGVPSTPRNRINESNASQRFRQKYFVEVVIMVWRHWWCLSVRTWWCGICGSWRFLGLVVGVAVAERD